MRRTNESRAQILAPLKDVVRFVRADSSPGPI